jgi:putative endonuclease
MNVGAYLYIVRCSDGSLYIGTTRTTLEIRVAQHNDGTFKGYTESRRPVVLVYAEWFDRITDAIENERKLKKWTRAKKRRSYAVILRHYGFWQSERGLFPNTHYLEERFLAGSRRVGICRVVRDARQAARSSP